MHRSVPEIGEGVFLFNNSMSNDTCIRCKVLKGHEGLPEKPAEDSALQPFDCPNQQPLQIPGQCRVASPPAAPVQHISKLNDHLPHSICDTSLGNASQRIPCHLASPEESLCDKSREMLPTCILHSCKPAGPQWGEKSDNLRSAACSPRTQKLDIHLFQSCHL